jgi:peptidoglycan hydrolase CwlO-like protein
MKDNKFRTPLLQSAAVLGGVLLLAIIAASSGTGHAGGGFFAVLSGIGNTILFVIGLVVGLILSIAILVGVFLAAVAMVSPEQASQMYSDLKKNFALSLWTCKNTWSCCENTGSGICISDEEYNRMKNEIADLQNNNGLLLKKIDGLQSSNDLFRVSFDELSGETASHKGKIDELHFVVEKLQKSEIEIKNLLDDLTAKVQKDGFQDISNQIDKLQAFQAETKNEIDRLHDRLNNLESTLNQSSTSGIFSYIEVKEDQTIFIKTVEEAISQGLTYAQIDEYLSTKLPAELHTTIKSHPSLTRNYIRSLRRD